jgi:hypothetical protein
MVYHGCPVVKLIEDGACVAPYSPSHASVRPQRVRHIVLTDSGYTGPCHQHRKHRPRATAHPLDCGLHVPPREWF